MRIDFNYAPQAAAEAGAQNPAASGKAARNSAQVERTQAGDARTGAIQTNADQTQLSGAHLQVQSLTEQASQLPEVRQARVESLRQALLAGHYAPAADKIANAVVDHMVVGKAA